QGSRPGRAVLGQQLVDPGLHFRAAPVLLRHAGEGALQADELAARVAALLQPVGVGQPRRVIVGAVEDDFEERPVAGHAVLRPRRAAGLPSLIAGWGGSRGPGGPSPHSRSAPPYPGAAPLPLPARGGAAP